MRGVMLEVPSHLLDERARTGQDRRDEMWEGELHMVPPPEEEHQRLSGDLFDALRRPADEAGLLRRFEIGLFDPDVPGHTSYRQPDLALFAEEVRSRRGIEGAAALVVEIASPGDESVAKVAFYDRVGVGEVVVVDRDTKEVRHWRRQDGRLREEVGHEARLESVAVTVREVGGRLEVATTAGVTLI